MTAVKKLTRQTLDIRYRTANATSYLNWLSTGLPSGRSLVQTNRKEKVLQWGKVTLLFYT